MSQTRTATGRPAPPRPRYRLTRRGKVVLALLPVMLLAVAAAVVWSLRSPVELRVTAPSDGALLGAEALTGSLDVSVQTPAAPERVTVRLDGEELPLTPTADGARAPIDRMDDGEHVLEVVVAGTLLELATRERRTFTVDTTAPSLEILEPTGPVPPAAEMQLRVEVDDPEAEVEVGGEVVPRGDEGEVVVTYPEPPEGVVTVAATDAAGNVASERIPITLALPGVAGGPPIRGVHATGYTWDADVLREPILEMIDQGLINTVEIAIKDEGGFVYYDTGVELAHTIGAVEELWDLAEVVDQLHARGVRVIGRVVVFRDAPLANHAIDTGQTDMIVQNPDGTPYGKYGGFTNPYSPEVWEYNLALAEEAARLGVDDVMFDYVRRPDDFIENLRFPLQDRPPEEAIVGFLDEARTRVHDTGARVGAAVFGIAATRPDEIAQDVPAIGEVVDFVSPMVYPSHWGPGEYGVADPNSQPYGIVHESMLDFQRQLEGTDTQIVVWLQDFSLGVDYGPTEVRAQIQAAADAGVDHWLLWDPRTTYTAAALDPIDR